MRGYYVDRNAGAEGYYPPNDQPGAPLRKGATGAYEQALVEVVDAIETGGYPVETGPSARRFALGQSMGAYGAVRIALDPDLPVSFSGVAAQSGFFDPSGFINNYNLNIFSTLLQTAPEVFDVFGFGVPSLFTILTVPGFLDDPGNFFDLDFIADHDPIQLASQPGGPLPPMHLEVGSCEGGPCANPDPNAAGLIEAFNFHESNRALCEAIDARNGLGVATVRLEGRHEESTWTPHLGAALGFFAQIVRNEQLPEMDCEAFNAP